MSQLGGPGARQANAKPIPYAASPSFVGHTFADWRPKLTDASHTVLNVAASHLIMTVCECKHVITTYLECIKKVRGVNDPECRDLAKSYLACRMDRNLMAKDEFKNLGFGDGPTLKTNATIATQDQGASSKETDARPGELRW
ncbi:putative CHCH domain-containing protein [Colletotrichum sublineola]|uniref:Putative CHCH domain-containing protein n=1 Tax=Colletotrichum sublineola TaxID=1173701 RepID=A0A066XWJ1_COLSU|nr:putative CHCH domain-containing protein [Colletotrichum sublineola]